MNWLVAMSLSVEQNTCDGKLTIPSSSEVSSLRIIFIYISDLKAFERRLTEVIASVQPATRRWRSKLHSFSSHYSIGVICSDNLAFAVSLALVFVCVAVGACYWLQDPDLYKISLFQSLFRHPLFSVSAIVLSKV